jgi:hypothetical protein
LLVGQDGKNGDLMSDEEFYDLKTKVAVLQDRSDTQQKAVAELSSLNGSLKAMSVVPAILGLGGLGGLVFSGWTYVNFLSEQTHIFNRPVKLVTRIDGATLLGATKTPRSSLNRRNLEKIFIKSG